MGYVNHSMSNRACEAYSEGRKPLSRWSKDDIVSNIDDPVARKIAAGLSVSVLKSVYLRNSGEWHHTSSRFNQTPFYQFSDDGIDSDVLKSFFSRQKKEKFDRKPLPEVKKCALVSFDEWSGTRNHPVRKSKTGVATWTEKGGKTSMADIKGSYEKKRVSSLSILKFFERKLRKNSKVWKNCDYK